MTRLFADNRTQGKDPQIFLFARRHFVGMHCRPHPENGGGFGCLPPWSPKPPAPTIRGESCSIKAPCVVVCTYMEDGRTAIVNSRQCWNMHAAPQKSTAAIERKGELPSREGAWQVVRGAAGVGGGVDGGDAHTAQLA